jgi:hypothetical protein
MYDNPNGTGIAGYHSRSLLCCGDESSHQTQPDNFLLIKQNKQTTVTSKEKKSYTELCYTFLKILWCKVQFEEGFTRWYLWERFTDSFMSISQCHCKTGI